MTRKASRKAGFGPVGAVCAVGAALGLALLSVIGVYLSMRAGLWNTDYASLRATYAGPPSRFAALDGAKIHYRDEGSGRPLVLLHGSGASLHEWDEVAELLRARYRVIRLDWPPFGLSVDTTQIYNSPRAAHLLAALMDHLALQKFTLVATSNGGNVALAYAALHPERLDALAFSVLPIAPLLPNRAPSWRVRFMTWFFPNYLPDYHPRWFYRTIFEETTAPNFEVTAKDLASVYEQNNLPGAAARQAAYIAANRKMFLTGDAGAAAKTITVPVLLQWCDLDTVIVPKSRGDEAAARFSPAKVTLIHYPDIGHFPMLENPQRFVADLSAFIDGLPVDSLPAER